MMVNRAFARRYLPEGATTMVGLHLALADGALPPSRIAGVMGDAREQGLDRVPEPTA